jgi:hypothetical protein
VVPQAGFWHNYGMPKCADKNVEIPPPVPSPAEPAAPSAQAQPRPREIGGPPGPEPTRYGDWEKKGRCIDF